MQQEQLRVVDLIGQVLVQVHGGVNGVDPTEQVSQPVVHLVVPGQVHAYLVANGGQGHGLGHPLQGDAGQARVRFAVLAGQVKGAAVGPHAAHQPALALRVQAVRQTVGVIIHAVIADLNRPACGVISTGHHRGQGHAYKQAQVASLHDQPPLLHGYRELATAHTYPALSPLLYPRQGGHGKNRQFTWPIPLWARAGARDRILPGPGSNSPSPCPPPQPPRAQTGSRSRCR